MTTNLAKIQGYIPQAVLDKLTEYQQSHNLNSISQSVAAVLVEFFDLNQSQLEPIDRELLQRIQQLESTVASIVEQINGLEQDGLLTRQATECHANREIDNPSIVVEVRHLEDCVLTVENSKTTNSSSEQPSRSAWNSNLPDQPVGGLKQREQISSSNSCGESPEKIKLEKTNEIDPSRGISSSMLAKRLDTNAITLRKYLREQRQMHWAALRDPEGWGWVYDSLLQRYYPVPVDSKHAAYSSTSVPSSANPNSTSFQEASIETVCSTELQGDKDRLLVCYEGGISQAQLSQLTGIPTNTLQRWKQMPNCAELIQQRTQGKFIYWYHQQYKLFYPVTLSSRT